jgi:outer membrane protein
MLLRMEVLKTLFTATLIATLLIAANASAQVSNAEGIEPMEGVEIPKVQKNQPQSIKSKNLIRIGFINTDQLFKLTGKAITKESIDFSNLKLKSFAEKNNIGLVLQEAVYVNPNVNITTILALYIEGKSFSNDFVSNLPVVNPNFIKFINTDRIFNETVFGKNAINNLEKEFKTRENELASFSNKSSNIFMKKKEEFQNDLNRRKNEELQKVLSIFNEKVKKLSLEMSIDLILQKAAYISPELDFTDQILSMDR